MAVSNNKYTQIINIRSIRSRLVISFVWILLLFGFALFVASLAVNHLIELRTQNKDVFKPLESYTYQILVGFNERNHVVQKALYQKDTAREPKIVKIRLEKIWKNQIQPHYDTLQYFVNQYKDEEMSEIYRMIRVNIGNLQKSYQQAAAFQNPSYLKHFNRNQDKDTTSQQIKIFYNKELALLAQTKIDPLLEETQELLAELVEKSKVIEASKNLRLDYWLQVWLVMELILIMVLLLSIFLIVTNLIRFLINELRLVRHNIQGLLNGNIPKKTRPQSKEFIPLTNTLNALVQPLKDVQQFAINVGQQKFDNEISLFGDKGNLGEALAQMRDELKRVSNQTNLRTWTNTGIAQFSEILTRNANNLDKLANELIAGLAMYLEINQGGFFVLEQKGEQRFMELKAAYAYDKKRFLENAVAIGQGLIGQAWSEGDLIYLKEIPENYVEITSGLGAAKPKALLIVPLKANGEVHGIIELASFEEITAYKIEFIKKIAESTGQVIATARINEQTKNLLHDSQALTQTLQSQDEMMRQNMQELQDTQKLMSSTQEELAEKEANLDALINNTSHAIIAFDKDYNITVVNKAMRQMYLEAGIELTAGKNLLKELPSEDYDKHKNEYYRVLRGEKFVILRENESQYRKTFHELHYNPILNEAKQIIGASIFIENITQRKQAEIQLKETESHLSSLINDNEDMIMAVDINYRLLIFNEAFAKQFGKMDLNVEQNAFIFDFIPEKEKIRWKNCFDMALAGDRFVKVFDAGKYPDKTYMEHWFNPIRDENEKVTGVSVFSRDVTASKQSENKIKQLLLESLESTETLKQQEEEMKQKIKEYEIRILELEGNKV